MHTYFNILCFFFCILDLIITFAHQNLNDATRRGLHQEKTHERRVYR